MIRSMTAFARRSRRTDWGELVWEIRAVNHRYLEMGFRLPEDLRALEPACRKAVSGKLQRGKVDCGLRVRFSDHAASDIQLNQGLVDALVARVGEIAGQLPRPAKVDPLRLLRWPGVVAESERDLGPVEREALTVLGEALDMLLESRHDEGERISAMILARCDAIAEQVQSVRDRLPDVQQQMRARITSRLEEITAEYDNDRLEQELALMAQKMDVDEELDRLSSHIAEARKVLSRKDAVGRRLDFLLQEFNREANTLASKSHDNETTRAAVTIKVLVEQVREQVQNVE